MLGSDLLDALLTRAMLLSIVAHSSRWLACHARSNKLMLSSCVLVFLIGILAVIVGAMYGLGHHPVSTMPSACS